MKGRGGLPCSSATPSTLTSLRVGTSARGRGPTSRRCATARTPGTRQLERRRPRQRDRAPAIRMDHRGPVRRCDGYLASASSAGVSTSASVATASSTSASAGVTVSSATSASGSASTTGSGLRGSLGGLGLLGDDGLENELDLHHRGVVALAEAELRDAGVAALTLGDERSDLGEELVHDALVTDDAEHATTSVQVSALGERDETLGDRTQALGLGLGRLDALVREQLRQPGWRAAGARAPVRLRGGVPWWA